MCLCVISLNLSEYASLNCVCVCVCVESVWVGLSQSESLGAFLNGQQQHVPQLLIALVGWEVQLVEATGEETNGL